MSRNPFIEVTVEIEKPATSLSDEVLTTLVQERFAHLNLVVREIERPSGGRINLRLVTCFVCGVTWQPSQVDPYVTRLILQNKHSKNENYHARCFDFVSRACNAAVERDRTITG